MNMQSSIQHLYAHIPFCPVKCDYCAFVTHIGSLKLLDPYMHALEREAEMVASAHPGGPLKTVYLGGGTPSMIGPVHLKSLLGRLDSHFGVHPEAEITLEAHPACVDAEKLHGFRDAGATRVSLGAESLSDRELSRIGRLHSGSAVLSALKLARAAGFQSINLDFMYGLPGQSLTSWEETLRAAVAASPDHLSLYPLSVEPGTVFARDQKGGRLPLPADEAVWEMYHMAVEILTGAGYLHYEIANWALPGHEARHNLAYWHNREFYAIGVGAHGYVKPYRFENMSHTRQYIDRIATGKLAVKERTYIAPETEISESIMLRLRLLQEGLDVEEIQARYGVDVLQTFQPAIQELTQDGLVRLDGTRLLLQEASALVGNEVWQRFV